MGLVRQIPELTRPKWRDEAQRSGRVVDVELDLAEVPSVPGKAAELREVLTNLVFNAVDALPNGGHIRLRVRATPKNAVVEVSDTGIGMTDDVRARCFDPFFSTKGSAGTGLGLSVCHGIVRRHGGMIEIDSAPGQGTTFRILLPLAGQPLTPTTITPPDLLPSWRVLYVDDDPRARGAISVLLQRLGLVVDVADGGASGLGMFRSTPYDVVITDLGMPEVSGLEVTQIVKSQSPDTPVIMLTGWGESALAQEGQLEAPDCILGKPLTLSALHDALAKFRDRIRR